MFKNWIFGTDIVYFYARTHWDCVVPRGSFTTKLKNNQLSAQMCVHLLCRALTNY
jgi:hypothetical protein